MKLGVVNGRMLEPGEVMLSGSIFVEGIFNWCS